LQGLLLRAKRDFDSLPGSKPQEGIRREASQALTALIDLREEYASKLDSLGEKHDLERQRLLSDNSSLQKRLDSLATQLAYMEKKETKLFGQLEEAREL